MNLPNLLAIPLLFFFILTLGSIFNTPLFEFLCRLRDFIRKELKVKT